MVFRRKRQCHTHRQLSITADFSEVKTAGICRRKKFHKNKEIYTVICSRKKFHKHKEIYTVRNYICILTNITIKPKSDWSFCTPIFQLWFFQVVIEPARYWHNYPIFDKLKHRKRYLEVMLFLQMQSSSNLFFLGF